MLTERTAPLDGVETADLQNALEQSLSEFFGAHKRIAHLERTPSFLRSSFSLEELDLKFEDDTMLSLMWKDAGSRALAANAQLAKPAFLYQPLREIETYRAILAPHHISAPRCYGAVVDPARERYWLFLEKVDGQALYQFEISRWHAAARWLARLHAKFNAAANLLTHAPLIQYDADLYMTWLARAQAFAASERAAEKLDWLAERYGAIVARLVELPATFLHGEFYASNVLLAQAQDETRVCPVDWEMAALAPGLIDLAALIAGNWSEEDKGHLAQSYRDELERMGALRLSRQDFWRALSCCRIHVAVQWLGWSPHWTPPGEHAHDWLSEAITLAESLEWG